MTQSKMRFYGLQGWKMEKASIADDEELRRRKAKNQNTLRFNRTTYRVPDRAPWLPRLTKAEKEKERAKTFVAKRDAKAEQAYPKERTFWRNFVKATIKN